MRQAVAILAALGTVAAAAAQSPAQPPTTKVLDCTNAGCHAKEMDHQFLHGPTAVQACDACHEYQDPAKHTFVMKRQGRDLCAFCHIDKAGTEAPVVHAPVAKGDCLACHDPHGARSKPLLKKDPMPALCADCHKDVLKGAHVHGPAAAECTACHQAHTADHAKLLNQQPRPLCLSCHEDVAKAVAGSKHPHAPASSDCLQCHSPHATDHAGVLRMPAQQLCLSCHEDVGKAIAGSAHGHAPVTDERSCLNCHAPHGSDHAKQMVAGTVDTCLTCHAKPIRVDEKRTVAGVPEIASASMHKHGPIAEGNCSGCHGVHGAPEDRLLEHAYAPGFYQRYSEQAYALCFKCHDKSLAVAPSAENETRFRDGSRNLHYLHVAKGTQGRSCRACHTVHASRFDTLVADTVSFGQWNLPINYKQTQTGGSCAPGCHKPQPYDRVTPAKATTLSEPAGKILGPAAAPGK